MQDPQSKFLVVCHQNIQSISKNTQRIEVLLHNQMRCDVLALTEHFLTAPELNCVHIDGYRLVSKYCRTCITQGGSCIYVRSEHNRVENMDLVKLSVERYCEMRSRQLNSSISM